MRGQWANGRRSTPRRTQSGLTLIEVLVAMSLLALAMSIVAGGLQIGVRSWTEGEERTHDAERVRTTYRVLRRLVAQATPAQVDSGKGWRYVFEGTREQVRMVAPAPQGAGLEAPAVAWLQVKRRGEGLELSVLWRPFDGRRDRLGRPPEAERTVLAEDLRRARLDYLIRPERGAKAKWRSEWRGEDPGPPPLAVRLRVEDGDGQWPDLVAPMRIEAEHACVIRSPSRGLCRVLRYD